MGIDATALLRIRKLAAPATPYGTTYFVQHRGDCTLLHTMLRFEGQPPDEHALAVRKILGDQLDAHQDPRGILFFPDVCEPKGKSYEAIVAELGGAGVWSRVVGADHVPDRITRAQPGTFEHLLKRAHEQLGADGRGRIEMAEVSFLLARGGGEHAAEYRAELQQLGASLGAEFVTELEAAFEARRVAQEQAEAANEARWAPLRQRMAEGKPLISDDDVSRFFSDPGAQALIESFAPGLKGQVEALVNELAVDLEALPENDVGKQLARTLGVKSAKRKKKKAPGKKKVVKAKRPRRKR